MKSMSISVILDWIPDKYRIFYKSTGLDQLFRHARMLDDSMEIIDNDFLYLTQEISLYQNRIKGGTDKPFLDGACRHLIYGRAFS